MLYGAALILSMGTFVFISLQEPHGGWDAWWIWNTRAKILFHCPTLEIDAFRTVGGQPDYPLLIPGSIARMWKYMGSSGTIAAISFHFFITFGTILLVSSSIAILRDKTLGLIVGMILIGTAYFIREGAAQQADVTVSFFILATFVLLSLNDEASENHPGFSFLAGMAAGFSAWTKNEGLLFVVCIMVARTVVLVSQSGWKACYREMMSFSAGLLPVLAVVLYFKIHLAPPNTAHIAVQDFEANAIRLTTPSRYFETAKYFVIYLLSYNRWEIYPIALIIYFVFFGIDKNKARSLSFKTAVAAILLMLCGYFFVLIISPVDLTHNLKAAVPRLTLQLWPSLLFSAFLVIRT